MANPAANQLISPFIREPHVVDLFIDFEFVDQGQEGTDIISLGAVVCGSQRVRLFYGLNTDFFKSKSFKSLVKGHDDQCKWMQDHVLVHITGTAVAGSQHKHGRITELLDILTEPDAVFTPDFDQTYPLPVRDWSTSISNENDPDVIVVGNINRIKTALHETIDEVRTEKHRDKLSNVTRTWGYYSATDFHLLQNLHGGMRNMPETFYYFAYDLRAIGDVFGYDHDSLTPNTPHHSLSDAVAQYKTTQDLRKKIAQDHKHLVPQPELFW